MLKSAIWFVTMACNLKCEYCWEVQAQRQGEFMPLKVFRTWKEWLEVWNRYRPQTLDITGGEPFLLDGLVDLMAGLDNTIKIGLTSNLTHPVTDLLSKVPASRFAQVTCSFHPTQPKQNHEVFVGRCLRLAAMGYPVVVNMVVWPDTMHRAWEWQGHFKRLGLRFHFDKYYPLYDKDEMTQNEKRMALQMFGDDRQPPTYANAKEVMCSGGIDHINVQPDGSAWRCLIEAKQKINCLGNVFSVPSLLRSFPLPCYQRHSCPNCDMDKVTVTI